jgi:hypothetical protein
VAKVRPDDHGVITLIRLEGDSVKGVKAGQRSSCKRSIGHALFAGLDLFGDHLLHFRSKDDLGRRSRVDTVGLDRDDDVAAVFKKVVTADNISHG